MDRLSLKLYWATHRDSVFMMLKGMLVAIPICALIIIYRYDMSVTNLNATTKSFQTLGSETGNYMSISVLLDNGGVANVKKSGSFSIAQGTKVCIKEKKNIFGVTSYALAHMGVCVV